MVLEHDERHAVSADAHEGVVEDRFVLAVAASVPQCLHRELPVLLRSAGFQIREVRNGLDEPQDEFRIGPLVHVRTHPPQFGGDMPHRLAVAGVEGLDMRLVSLEEPGEVSVVVLVGVHLAEQERHLDRITRAAELPLECERPLLLDDESEGDDDPVLDLHSLVVSRLQTV